MLPICLGEATKVAGDIARGAQVLPLQRRARQRAPRPAMPKARSSKRCPVPPLSAAHVAAVLAALPGRAASRCRRCIRRSSATDSRCTSWRAPGVERAARAARSIEIFEPDARGAHARRIWSWRCCAPRAPTSGCWPRTSPARSAPAGTWRACGACRSSPSPGTRMLTLESLRGTGRSAGAPRATAADRCGRSCTCRRSASTMRTRRRLRQGQARRRRGGAEAARVRLYGPDGAFLGLGEADGAGGLQPRRLIVGARKLILRRVEACPRGRPPYTMRGLLKGS